MLTAECGFNPFWLAKAAISKYPRSFGNSVIGYSCVNRANIYRCSPLGGVGGVHSNTSFRVNRLQASELAYNRCIQDFATASGSKQMSVQKAAPDMGCILISGGSFVISRERRVPRTFWSPKVMVNDVLGNVRPSHVPPPLSLRRVLRRRRTLGIPLIEEEKLNRGTYHQTFNGSSGLGARRDSLFETLGGAAAGDH